MFVYLPSLLQYGEKNDNIYVVPVTWKCGNLLVSSVLQTTGQEVNYIQEFIGLNNRIDWLNTLYYGVCLGTETMKVMRTSFLCCPVLWKCIELEMQTCIDGLPVKF